MYCIVTAGHCSAPYDARSQFRPGTDADGIQCIVYTPTNILKQHQGGLQQSRGVQKLAEVTEIPLYGNAHDSFLCIIDWYAEHQAYVMKISQSSKAELCDKVFLQVKHSSKPKGKDAGAASADDPFEGIVYADTFINGPLGEHKLNDYLKLMCRVAGVPERTNHALRRSCVTSCYAAGMPEIATMRLSRHTSSEGLRAYAG